MKLQIKRAYEKATEDDGIRILVDRIWPRGISKEKAAIDHWIKDIAPTAELRKWYGHDPGKYQEFRERYCKELDENPHVGELMEIISESPGNVTLVFAAKDEEHSNAKALLDWLGSKC